MKVKRIDKILNKLKDKILKYYKKNNLERSLKFLKTLSDVLYASNYQFADCFSEEMLKKITMSILPEGVIIEETSQCVIFYDGFGLLNRGLMKIYLSALNLKNEVIYIGKKENLAVNEFLDTNDIKHVCLSSASETDKIKELADIISDKKPLIFFNYTTPSDVVSNGVMSALVGKTKRVMINLTDHAYWLGSSYLDYSIEFRDYGASISYLFRNIPKEKLIKIPFYPVIDENVPFKGFPFKKRDNDVVVFSGGSLYKTFDKSHSYYDIVEKLLTENDNLIFRYAGSGNRKYIDKIIKKFPNRCFLTSERDDLFQVLSHSTFYLSTYPVCGGLMYQYAAKAGKVPLTLLHSDISDDFLLNQSELNIDFKNSEELLNEANKLITDKGYRDSRSVIMKNSVTSKEEFNNNVDLFVDSFTSNLNINYKIYDLNKFKTMYLINFTYKEFCNIIAQKDCVFFLKDFLFSYCFGAFNKICSKIKNRKED